MLEWTDGQVAWQTISPEGVLPQKEHTPIVDGKLKIDIPLSKDFISTYQAMEKVRTHCPGLISADSVYQLVDKGLVKCIGVSNFNIYRLKQLLAAAKHPPVASE
jgi:diketogulonate reductase-like aldo/keto reductase